MPKDGEAKLEYGSPRQVFKINIDPDFGEAKVDVRKSKEQEILGKDFLESYREFVNEYSKPKLENYVQVKSEFDPVAGKMVDVAAIQNGAIQTDTAAFNRDAKIQSAKVFADKAQTLEKTATAPQIETEKDGTLALKSGFDQKSLGFNDRVSEETAKKYAENLNANIDKQLHADKVKNGVEEESYFVTTASFNEFLDGIWPPAAGPRAH